MPQSGLHDRLIVALDTDNAKSAHACTVRLGDTVGFYKIGLGLLANGGLSLAAELKTKGKRVFLDLKLFDIASTVERAVRALVQHLDPDFLTVHGDPQVVAAAVRARGKADTRILAVTILTNLQRKDLDGMLIAAGDIESTVRSRAERALASGANGLIASPREITALRRLPTCMDRLLVTPGIRPTGAKPDDQKRRATPAEAIGWGADHIVVGRPILEAPDPAAAAEEILNEIRDATAPPPVLPWRTGSKRMQRHERENRVDSAAQQNSVSLQKGDN